MFKKTTTLFVLLTILAISLAACGNSDSPSQDPPIEADVAAIQTEATAASVITATEQPSTEDDAGASPQVDAEVPLQGDAGVPLQGDAGVPPQGDAGGPPPRGGGAGRGPDLVATAATLGVSEDDLRNALGAQPIDFEAAAATLGVTVEALQEALGAPPQN